LSFALNTSRKNSQTCRETW